MPKWTIIEMVNGKIATNHPNFNVCNFVMPCFTIDQSLVSPFHIAGNPFTINDGMWKKALSQHTKRAHDDNVISISFPRIGLNTIASPSPVNN